MGVRLTRSTFLAHLAAAACATGCAVDSGPAPLDDVLAEAPMRWSVSYHTWPGDGTRASGDLALIAELGAGLVRTDAWWYAIEPARGQIDQAALDYYRWYVEEAGRHGLDVLVVLSNPPDWARQLYQSGDRGAFCAEFGEYAAAVGETVGDLVADVQLWNEPNHIVDVPDGDADVCLFLEGRRGLELGRQRAGAGDGPLRTYINLLVDGHDAPIGPSWQTDVDFYMERGAGSAIDVIGIDHYPGTWAIGDWGGNILDRLFALGLRHGKEVAILETGFSTAGCILPLNTEPAEVGWIDSQLPRIRAKASDPAVHRGVRLVLANWFKLDDRPATDCWDLEDNFGVVRQDRTRKPAFDALRAAIAAF
jgi:hypothetical protein